MAAGGLLSILDDISLLLDDVAAMSKVAAKKTAGIVGDDLAVNANVVVGLEPNRELPIVGKIALGSLANKAVLIPLALALPTAVIQPALMLGGAFLCYEALHKVMHRHDADEEHHQKLTAAAQAGPEALLQMEKAKIRGAIGTDAILSAEVIAVALGTVATAPFMTRALVMTLVGLVMTLGVYGLVAAIVKVDDLGLRLQRLQGDGSATRALRSMGKGLVNAMPWFMKALSVLGTAAMFSVGGGILLHGIHFLGQGLESVLHGLPGIFAGPLEILATIVFGALVGLVAMPFFNLLGKGLTRVRQRFQRDRGHRTTASRARPQGAGQPHGAGQV